jgi:hypothetical protein
MDIGFRGFPGLEQLNKARNELWYASHGESDVGIRFGSWLGHKTLTVITLPANVAGVTIGIAGMIGTACTLGTLKVGIFAATLGNVRPDFSIGFIWCLERTVHSIIHLGLNLGELAYDAGNAVYLGYRLIRWIGDKLHLGPLFNEIFRELGRLFDYVALHILKPALHFVAKRLDSGIKKAIADEENVTLRGGTPSFIKPLDDWTKENRIDGSQDRSWTKIFKHYCFSVANIPVNAVVASAAGGAAAISSAAFVGKVILYATTSINIPVPTFAGQMIVTTYAATSNVAADIATNIGDVFVVIYKTACALRINRVMATALDVLLYIPVAVLS